MMNSEISVAQVERWASALGGAALAAYGFKRLREERSLAAMMLAAAGGGLIYRSATGSWPIDEAVGISTAADSDDTRTALAGPRGIHVRESVTINRPSAELYACWRKLDELPRFMAYVEAVEVLDDRHSRWRVKAPVGRTVEWDAEIINDVPNELIGWRTLSGADVISAGSVTFKATPDGRRSEVRVHLQYEPPAGRAGAALAWALGRAPSQTIREDLRRFKQLMEAGEVPTTDGQPRGK
jgi:uncharacterized membrane protein